MLKYVALLRVDQPKLWSRWHSGSTERYYKSSIEEEKNKVEEWLKKELTKYPNARINERIADKEYLIYTTILAFDEQESDNFLEFLNRWIPF